MAGLNSATRMGEGDAYVFNFQPALAGLNRAVANTQIADRKREAAAQQALDKILAENQAGKQGLRSADVEPYLKKYSEFENAAKAAIAEKDPLKKSQWNAIRNEAAGSLAKLTAKSKETSAKLAQELSNIQNHPERIKDEFDDNGKKVNTRQYVTGLNSIPSDDIEAMKGLDGSRWFFDPLNVDIPYFEKNVLNPVELQSARPVSDKPGYVERIKSIKHNELPIAIQRAKDLSVGKPEYAKMAKVVFDTDKTNAENGKDVIFKEVAKYVQDKGVNQDILQDPLTYLTAKKHMQNKDGIISVGEQELSEEQKRKNEQSDKAVDYQQKLNIAARGRSINSTNTDVPLEDIYTPAIDFVKRTRIKNGNTIPLNSFPSGIQNFFIDVASKRLSTADGEKPDVKTLAPTYNDNGTFTLYSIKEEGGRQIRDVKLGTFTKEDMGLKVAKGAKERAETLRDQQKGKSQTQQAAPKKTINRADIAAKAAAAGYSTKEYEALLIKNGVTIK